MYKKNTYHTCGYHSLSKTHTKTKDHPKPTLHPKYVFHTKNDLHPEYRLHPSHTLHSRPILLTKLYLKPKGHPKYKPNSHNNAYPNLHLHPKPKAHSKYIPHPKPHIAYNLYTKYKSQQTQYTQLKNKMASAYRPRHIIKNQNHNTKMLIPNVITNHLPKSKNTHTHFPPLQLRKLPTLPNLIINTKTTCILANTHSWTINIPYPTLSYHITHNTLHSIPYHIKQYPTIPYRLITAKVTLVTCIPG